jgi:hypothetical protein
MDHFYSRSDPEEIEKRLKDKEERIRKHVATSLDALALDSRTQPVFCHPCSTPLAIDSSSPASASLSCIQGASR